MSQRSIVGMRVEVLQGGGALQRNGVIRLAYAAIPAVVLVPERLPYRTACQAQTPRSLFPRSLRAIPIKNVQGSQDEEQNEDADGGAVVRVNACVAGHRVDVRRWLCGHSETGQHLSNLARYDGRVFSGRCSTHEVPAAIAPLKVVQSDAGIGEIAKRPIGLPMVSLRFSAASNQLRCIVGHKAGSNRMFWHAQHATAPELAEPCRVFVGVALAAVIVVGGVVVAVVATPVRAPGSSGVMPATMEVAVVSPRPVRTIAVVVGARTSKCRGRDAQQSTEQDTKISHAEHATAPEA